MSLNTTVDADVVDSNAIILGASTVGGNLSVTSHGDITQTGVLLVGGTSTFTVDTVDPLVYPAGADVLLHTQPNDLAGAVTISTINGGSIRDIGLRNINTSANLAGVPTIARNLTVIFNNAPVVLPTSNLTGFMLIIAGGDITQTGVLTVAGTATFTIDTVQQKDILLQTLPNDIAGLVTFNTVNGGTIRDIGLRNINVAANLLGMPNTARNFTIIFDNAPVILPMLTLTGYMDITAGGVTPTATSGTIPPDVAITQTGVLTVAGTSTFTVETVQQADVLLADYPNDLAGAVTITTANGGTIRDVALRNINPSANLLGVPTILRNLTIIFDNAPVVLPLTTLTGNLIVIAGGDISQVDVVTVAGTSSLNAGPHAITLDNPNNDFGGAVMLINTGPNNIVITDVNNIIFGTSTIGSGTLTVNAVGVTQVGPITQEAAAGAATFNSSTGAIVLTDPGNDFTGPVSLYTTTDASVVDSNAIILGASTVGGNLDITAHGDITELDSSQYGVLQVSGTSTFTIGTLDPTVYPDGADVLLLSQPNDLAGLVTIQPVNDPADLTVPPNPALIRDIGLRNVNPSGDRAAHLCAQFHHHLR